MGASRSVRVRRQIASTGMPTNPLIAPDRAELSALIEHHLHFVNSLPDSPERDLHMKRAEHLNALLAEMPQ